MPENMNENFNAQVDQIREMSKRVESRDSGIKESVDRGESLTDKVQDLADRADAKLASIWKKVTKRQENSSVVDYMDMDGLQRAYDDAAAKVKAEGASPELMRELTRLSEEIEERQA